MCTFATDCKIFRPNWLRVCSATLQKNLALSPREPSQLWLSQQISFYLSPEVSQYQVYQLTKDHADDIPGFHPHLRVLLLNTEESHGMRILVRNIPL